VDIFGVFRVTWLPRTRRHDQCAMLCEPPGAGLPAVTAEAGASADRSAAGPSPDIVQGLIGLADALLDLTEHPSGPDSSMRTLRLVQRRVDRLLTDYGMRTVLDEGPVVPSRHEVVGTRPAGAHGAEGWIAATVRQGYLHGDRLIRPQQIVAYTAGKLIGADERNNSEG
jgi:hypothetical protein